MRATGLGVLALLLTASAGLAGLALGPAAAHEGPPLPPVRDRLPYYQQAALEGAGCAAAGGFPLSLNPYLPLLCSVTWAHDDAWVRGLWHDLCPSLPGCASAHWGTMGPG